ncbi:MAG: insulinase family protein, partial [Acidobacteriales bacterium]|nr:insulinase family protein [Terriglobales bacterium]
YALSPEYATIAAVTRDDMVAWHKQYVQPNNIILGIVGDFDSNEMERKLRDAFASWPRGPGAADPRIAFTPAKPGYYFVNKSDVNQSSVRMLGEGTTKQDPDFYAIEVFNEAFGGGFSSRLFRDLRTTKALAYSVGGGIGTRFDHPGVLQLAIGTKSESTVEAIRGLYQEVEDLKTKPLDEQEIKQAKDSILNSFIFNFDTPDKVLRERMAYEFYRYPPDFLERYRAGIEKVQPGDVARVAARFILDKHLPVLVVGNSAEFDKPLSSLGPVTTLDIAIPPPPAEPKTGGQ